MQYELNKVREFNLPAHDDIEKDIQDQQNGNFSFVLRINNGNIVDYTVVEYVDVGKYLASPILIKEFTISRFYRKNGRTNPLGNSNIQHPIKGGNSKAGNNEHS